MSQGNIPPKPAHRGLLTCITIVVVGVIGLVCVAGVGIWYFSRTTQSRNRPFLTVISAPTTGYVALSRAPIEIQASSTYSEGVIRLDLFADGGLIASQPTTLATGSNPLVMIHSWTPPTPGRHVLMARAHGKDGSRSDSAVVFIDVSQEISQTVVEVSDIQTPSGNPPTLNEISASTGISLGELLEANPDLEGTDPDEPLDEDDSITLPPAEEPGEAEGAPVSGAPAAPEGLTVAMTCTDATLTWTDASADEEGFMVYRIDPGTATLHEVTPLLPAGTTNYVDPLPVLGMYFYQIAARLGAEESFSAVVGAETPGPCAPPPGGLDLVLTIGLLETDNAFENAACYVVLVSAGLVVDRIPPGDFTGLPAVAPRQFRLDSMPNRGKYLLNFHDPATPVEFTLECMGRNPPLSDYIGNVNVTHPPADWADGSVRTATSTGGTNGGYTLSYCLGPSAIPCEIPGAPPPPASPWMIDPFLPPPTNVHLENSNITCLDIPEGFARVICQIMGSMIGGYRTVLWDWNGAPHYEEADLTGYHVRLESRDRSSAVVSLRGEWDVLRRIDGTLGRAIRDQADLSICGQDYRYYVSAVAADRRSVESDSFLITTEDCFDPVQVAVEFNHIDIHDVSDCGDTIFPLGTTVEVSVDYRVLSGIHGAEYHYHGPYDVPDGTNAAAADVFGGTMRPLTTIASDTQTIDVRLRLTDNDAMFTCPADPVFCDVHLELPARSRAEWQATTHTYINHDSNLDAHCTTTIIVDGTP